MLNPLRLGGGGCPLFWLGGGCGGGPATTGVAGVAGVAVVG